VNAKENVSHPAEPLSESTIIQDAIQAGAILATKSIGKAVEVTPVRDKETSRTNFKVTGDIRGALEVIADNHSVGIRTMIEAIKATRGMIWLMKGGR
jgi:hypothetical protein